MLNASKIKEFAQLKNEIIKDFVEEVKNKEHDVYFVLMERFKNEMFWNKTFKDSEISEEELAHLKELGYNVSKTEEGWIIGI